MHPDDGKLNRDHASDQALRDGAGDENRTRTISLGSGAVTAVRGAELATLMIPSSRG